MWSRLRRAKKDSETLKSARVALDDEPTEVSEPKVKKGNAGRTWESERTEYLKEATLLSHLIHGYPNKHPTHQYPTGLSWCWCS